MSSNPKSINHQPLTLDDGGDGGLGTAEGRALTRASRVDVATAGAASYSQEEREAAAKALQKRADG